jgi:hypothetical protein
MRAIAQFGALVSVTMLAMASPAVAAQGSTGTPAVQPSATATGQASIPAAIPSQPLVDLATMAPSVSQVTRSELGINTPAWNGQVGQPVGAHLVEALGAGVTRYPGGSLSDGFNWQNSGYWQNGGWTPEPTTLPQWANMLEQTGAKGVFTFNYGSNTTYSGPNTPANATAFADYVVSHHIPLAGVEIGNEVFGSWETDLAASHSALTYATTAAAMAKAIHAVDPQLPVGVDVELPNGPSDTGSLAWDQAVISTDAPYVQFLVVHYYGSSSSSVTPSQMLAAAAGIGPGMALLRSEIAQYGGANASLLQVWMTESGSFDSNPVPYVTLTGLQGEYLFESFVEAVSSGISQYDWWTLFSSTNSTSPPPVPPPGSAGSDGTLGIAYLNSNGSASTLLPAGNVFARIARAIGSGATMTTWPQALADNGLMAAEFASSSSTTYMFANNLPESQTVLADGQTVTVPGFSFESFDPSPGVPVNFAKPDMQYVFRPSLPQAQVSSVSGVLNPDGSETLSIAGSGFGDTIPPLTPANNGGYDSGNLVVTTALPNGQVSYGADGNWDGLLIDSWSNTQILATIPPGVQPIPAGAKILAFVTNPASGATVEQQAPPTPMAAMGMMALGSAQTPQGGGSTASSGPSASTGQSGAPQGTPPVLIAKTAMTDPAGGPEVVTIDGSGFGQQAPSLVNAHNAGSDSCNLRLTIGTGGSAVNYGSPGNWYGLQYLTWTSTQIVVQVPSGVPALPAGSTVSIWLVPTTDGCNGADGVTGTVTAPAS